MSINNLETLGWDKFFERSFQPYASNGYAAGRVASEYKHSIVSTVNRERCSARSREGCGTRPWTEEIYQ